MNEMKQQLLFVKREKADEKQVLQIIQKIFFGSKNT